MKKFISLLMILTLALTLMVGCGEKEKDYKLSIGVKVTENLAKSKLTETVASIVTDADGKVVLCRIDSIDYTVKYENDALVKTAPVSKVALGDSYSGMPAGTWEKQGKAFENYVVGKTQSEIAATALDGGKVTDTELKASCSIDVTDILAAIDNAFKSEHKVAFKASSDLTAGLRASATVSDKTKDESKNVQLAVTYGAAVMADGKVVAAILDTAEAQLNGINEENIATALSYKGTKREQGDSYDSYAPMDAGRWYEQADRYAMAAAGLTADNIATLATEGIAGCTINVTEYKAVLEAAVAAAK